MELINVQNHRPLEQPTPNTASAELTMDNTWTAMNELHTTDADTRKIGNRKNIVTFRGLNKGRGPSRSRRYGYQKGAHANVNKVGNFGWSQLEQLTIDEDVDGWVERPIDGSVWTCMVCTLANSGNNVCCAACTSVRPGVKCSLPHIAINPNITVSSDEDDDHNSECGSSFCAVSDTASDGEFEEVDVHAHVTTADVAAGWVGI